MSQLVPEAGERSKGRPAPRNRVKWPDTVQGEPKSGGNTIQKQRVDPLLESCGVGMLSNMDVGRVNRSCKVRIHLIHPEMRQISTSRILELEQNGTESGLWVVNY